MTLKHKFILFFVRIGWWFSLTEKARLYSKRRKEYYMLQNKLDEKKRELIELERVDRKGEEALRVQGEIRILEWLIG